MAIVGFVTEKFLHSRISVGYLKILSLVVVLSLKPNRIKNVHSHPNGLVFSKIYSRQHENPTIQSLKDF